MRSPIRGESHLDAIPAGFGELLHTWQKHITHQDWGRDNDCAWWYGERASVSQLAGAAWALRGWAMQEYAWTRGDEDSHARIDLAIEVKPLKLRFIAEAKQIYPNMISGRESLLEAIDTEFNKLNDEIKRIKDDDWDRVSVVFVSPRIRKADDLDIAIQKWISDLATCGDACVWCFPDWARSTAILSAVTNMYDPGAAVLVRHSPAPVSSSRHVETGSR